MNNAALASPSTPGSLLAPLADNDFLVQLISELTDKPRDFVRKKLAQEHERLGSAVEEEMRHWKLEPFVWTERLGEFYEQTDAFLYETLVWNRTEMKHQMRQNAAAMLALGRTGSQRVLVFGDGLGIDSLFLGEAGHSVDYYEVSQRCIRFAQRLGETVKRQLTIVSSPDEVVPASYDAVVCLDVLEHVPDPPELVALLASFLRPGGRLIAHAPFWYLHPSVSTHLKSNLRFSGELAKLYLANDLRPIAAEWFWNPIAFEKMPAEGSHPSLSLSTRAKIATGGLLLKSARLVRWPHLCAFHLMFRNDQRRLRQLAAGLKATVADAADISVSGENP